MAGGSADAPPGWATITPSERELLLARTEGWIHIPLDDSLERLNVE